MGWTKIGNLKGGGAKNIFSGSAKVSGSTGFTFTLSSDDFMNYDIAVIEAEYAATKGVRLILNEKSLGISDSDNINTIGLFAVDKEDLVLGTNKMMSSSTISSAIFDLYHIWMVKLW